VKYFKLCLNDSAGNPIYAKDVEVQNIFESFIRSQVSLLVKEGTIQAGEHYSAVMIPRYGEYLNTSLKQTIEPDNVTDKKEKWIDIQFEEPLQPDQPIRYLTLELYVQERNFIYRRDFQLGEVITQYVSYGITQALMGLGVMKDGDRYLTLLFARDDDNAEFDRERIPQLEQQAESLIEIVSETPERISFLYRDPSSYTESQVIGNPEADDICIYVNQNVMQPLLREGILSGKTGVERGGILVGSIYESTDSGRRIVEISDIIVSEHNASSVIELRYTFESWQAQNRRMTEEFPGKRIVGWYHTHLVDISMKTEGEKIEKTKMFFSRDDVFLHKTFFPEEWYVAMVLDPQENSIFFQWKDNHIVACSGYRIFEAVGIAK